MIEENWQENPIYDADMIIVKLISHGCEEATGASQKVSLICAIFAYQ